MQNTKQLTWIGLLSITAGLLAMASLATSMMAVNFNAEALANPVVVLRLPGVNTGLIKWSMLFDMLGYYLLLLPLIFLLQQQVAPPGLLSRLSSFCATAYVLIGAIGAAILSVVWPNIIGAYKVADAQTQVALATAFNAFNRTVYEGMWNLLEMIFAGAWWLMAGLLFYRRGAIAVGIFTAALGLSCLANAASVMFEIESLHRASLNIYLLLSIVWTILMGIRVLKSRNKFIQDVAPRGKVAAKRPHFSTS